MAAVAWATAAAISAPKVAAKVVVMGGGNSNGGSLDGTAAMVPEK